MKHIERLTSEMVKLQAQRDAEEARRIEEQAFRHRIVERVMHAKSIADSVAHYSGGQVYLGSDALTRDYFSEWFPIQPVEDKPGVEIQARIKRWGNVIKSNGIVSCDYDFAGVGVDIRLSDVERGIQTGTEYDVLVLKASGHIIKKDELGAVEEIHPESQDWEGAWDEISQILEQSRLALTNVPIQGQLQ